MCIEVCVGSRVGGVGGGRGSIRWVSGVGLGGGEGRCADKGVLNLGAKI